VNRHTQFKLEQRDDLCIVHITGRIATGADDEYIWAQALEIKRLGCRKIIADISELDSIGSTGIGFFVDLHTSMAKDASKRFVLVGASPRVLDVLARTRLDTILRLAPDLAAGLYFCAREDQQTHAAGPLA
jgi:anti-anti-sigma factor